jgi:D-alanyl-lipoteichoic acid acyltransferase DltB (MBOAT superfamily)
MFFIPKYILILAGTILVDYVAGMALERQKNERNRKYILWISVFVTCLILFVFKYYNFFSLNIAQIAQFFGGDCSIGWLSWALPIGLSFHTFQSLSYVIEVYYKRQKAEYNFLTYSLYVMYFPQLVAGPIERPANLLGQLNNGFRFNTSLARDGMRMILWGLFKKVVIADQCAQIVNDTYSDISSASSIDLWYAAILFSIQIYGDFSGYSDIARGCSQLFGIQLIRNFNFPYFSESIAEFWSRWHTSLSSWFRDYVYIPMGGNRVSKVKQVRNVLVVFLLSGLWHGAAWTFILWGLLNGVFVVLSSQISIQFTQWKALKIFITFLITTTLWVFFRAENLSAALLQIDKMFFDWNTSFNIITNLRLWIALIFFFSMEWIMRNKEHGLDIGHWKLFYRYSFYFLVYFLIFFLAVYPANQFIYFQF